MKVVVFAKTKGGVASTTLCYNVALMAAQSTEVFIADLDPQASLQDIWKRRNEFVNPRLITDVESVGRSVRLLMQAGYGRPFMFVDTPGSMMSVITDAVEAADLIVIPTQPSHLDLVGQDAIAARIEKMGLRHKTMFALTRTSNAADTEKARQYLQIRTPHPILEIKERADYKRAAEKGLAAWELSNNKDAKAEVRKLWETMQIAMKSAEAEQGHEQHTRH